VDEQSGAVAQDRAVTREYFSFTGTGGEYFRIWIVNMLLTVLTLGIYSPWAKVRRLRYIYGSTGLQEGRFDYHASPLVILRGRIIAVVFLLIYIATQAIVPFLSALLGLVLLLVIPWLIVRSRMFNMRYTSYRNIRLGFEPAYSESYKVIYLYTLLAMITFGLAAPYAHYKRSQFIVNNTRYGNLPLAMDGAAGAFFFAYFLTFVAAAVVIVPAFAYFAELVGSLKGGDATTQPSGIMFLPAAGVFAAYYVIGKFLSAATLQATVDASALGAGDAGEVHELGNDWSLNRILFIYFTNFIAIVCSLGSLIPWAQMRETRYIMEHTWIDADGSLDDVVARQEQEVSALGDEIGEVFDVDMGL